MLLVALFAVTLLPYAVVQAQTRTLIVPDQYQTIQAAIDSANAGDTVFVKSGRYAPGAKVFTGAVEDVSAVVINKQISLIGENASTTIIDVQHIPNGVGIWIRAHNVTVSGFTIKNYQDVGILVSNVDTRPSYPSENCSIQGNKLLNGDYGIWVDGGIGFNFTNNEIINNQASGIFLYPTAMDGIIVRNRVSGNNIGMSGGDNITIAGNNVFDNNYGISIGFCTQMNIYGNNVTDNKGTGIGFGQYCDHATVYGNNITGNSVGIGLAGFHRPGNERWALPFLKEYYLSLNFSDNTVYMNNFVDNSEQVLSVFPTDSGLVTFSVVSWDNGSVGNFWSDYQSKYPDATEIGSSGIGSLPYVIDANNTDHYPLLALADNTAPTIRVLSPENKNYTSNSISLNFMVDESTSEIVYSLDGQQNVTVTGNVTLSGLEAGLHNVTVYAVDAFGNFGASEIITFNVEAFPFLIFVAVTAVLVVVIGVLGLSFFRWRRKSSKTAVSV
jgi:parallel beta-helix repeat protein